MAIEDGKDKVSIFKCFLQQAIFFKMSETIDETRVIMFSVLRSIMV